MYAKNSAKVSRRMFTTGAAVAALGATGLATSPAAHAAPRDAFFDTSLSKADRDAQVSQLSSADVFGLLGQPNLIDDAKYHDAIRGKLEKLARLTAIHAIEVRGAIGWKVALRIIDESGVGGGYFDHEASPGGRVTLKGGQQAVEQDLTDLLAHELGHSVFYNAGFEDRMNQQVADRGLADRDQYGAIVGFVGEPFAGVWGGRAQVAMGSTDPKTRNRLSLKWDISNLMSDPGGYGAMLGPETLEALPTILELTGAACFGQLRSDFGFANDPDLTRDA